MRISSRRGTIVFFIILGIGLVALAVALNVGWIILNWREGVLLVFGIIFFALLIAGMVVNTIFLVREVRRSEQHDSFINAVTHELKTPVAILKSTLQSLVQVPRTADEYRARIEVALEDVARIEKLIHSMLRLARAEQSAAGHHRQDLVPVDLSVSCEQSADRLGAFAVAGGVAIEVRAENHLTIKADPEDLELIWNNLLENAIRYSPKSSRVLVTVSEQDHSAQVKVQDWGAGIAESELAHIFDRFHRADVSRTRETGGYGLGLAITKAMVNAYGGTIVVDSGVGAGTVMTVRLPLET